jgi:hypothetical protein
VPGGRRVGVRMLLPVTHQWRAMAGGVAALVPSGKHHAVRSTACERRPESTYDNFARDFGERFVPGYQAQSTVDLLLEAPFEE